MRSRFTRDPVTRDPESVPKRRPVGARQRALPLIGLVVVLALGFAVFYSSPMGRPTGEPRRKEVAVPQTEASRPTSIATDAEQTVMAKPTRTRSAREELVAVIAKYRHLKSYQDVTHARLQLPTDKGPFQVQVVANCQFRLPNQFSLKIDQGTGAMMIVSDGQQMRTWLTKQLANRFEGQVVEQPAPNSVSVAAIYAATEYVDINRPNELLSLMMNVPLPLPNSPLAWMTAGADAVDFVPPGVDPIRLEDATWDGELFSRIQVPTAAGMMVYWIDGDALIRRVEHPTRHLLPKDTPDERRQQASFVTEHSQIVLDRQIGNDAFEIDADTISRRVRHFVTSVDSQSPLALNTTPDPFAFVDLEGNRVFLGAPSTDLLVLAWFNDHPASRNMLQAVNQVAEQQQAAAGVRFLAVCTEPPTQTSDQGIANLVRQWQVNIPVVRDLDAVGRDMFAVEEAPTLVVLDKDGKVQAVEVGHSPDMVEQLPVVLEKLKAGEDLAAAYLEYSATRRTQYEQLLAAASVDAPMTEVPLEAEKISPPQMPKHARLQPLWSTAELTAKGNLYWLEIAGTDPVIVSVQGWQEIVILEMDGRIRSRHPLQGPDEIAATQWQHAVDGEGRIWHLVTANLTRQVHLFNDKWQHELSYPTLEQKHPGIQAARLADLDADGELELYVAFGGVVGVHRVSLAGQRQAWNRSTAPVLSLAPTHRDLPQPLLWATTAQGQIVALDAEVRNGQPRAVGDRAIHQLFTSQSAQPRATAYCGLTYLANGDFVALGLDARFQEQWSYPLPSGAYRNQIVPGQSAQVHGRDSWDWVLVGADGTVHWIADDGSRHDRWAVGKSLHGVCAGWHDGRNVIVISTAEGVEGWKMTNDE